MLPELCKCWSWIQCFHQMTAWRIRITSCELQKKLISLKIEWNLCCCVPGCGVSERRWCRHCCLVRFEPRPQAHLFPDLTSEGMLSSEPPYKFMHIYKSLITEKYNHREQKLFHCWSFSLSELRVYGQVRWLRELLQRIQRPNLWTCTDKTTTLRTELADHPEHLMPEGKLASISNFTQAKMCNSKGKNVRSAE